MGFLFVKGRKLDIKKVVHSLDDSNTVHSGLPEYFFVHDGSNPFMSITLEVDDWFDVGLLMKQNLADLSIKFSYCKYGKAFIVSKPAHSVTCIWRKMQTNKSQTVSPIVRKFKSKNLDELQEEMNLDLLEGETLELWEHRTYSREV